MNEKQISAIMTALDRGLRVELTKNENGKIVIRTVTRKELKIK